MEEQLAAEQKKRAALERLRAQLVAMRGESYISSIETQLAQSDAAAAAAAGSSGSSGRGFGRGGGTIDIKLGIDMGTQYDENDANGTR